MGIPTSIKFEDHTTSNEITSVPLLDVGRGNEPLKQDFKDAFNSIIESGRFIGGPHCQSLEQSMAKVCEAEFGIGCASGSAVPVFADIERGTFNIDPAHAETLVTSKTKAIIPVHLFGQCADMDAIMAIAKRHDLKVVEDCAQSIGATWNGQACGAIGDIGCFSFYPTKNLGGFGDGGMLTTNDEQLADRVRLLANHGMRPRYYHSAVGINSRLDSIQAALLGIKLQHLDAISSGRQENAARYDELFTEARLGQVIAKHVTKSANN